MQFHLYNTLSKQKELFEPIVPGKVGLYVCGPTVYGEPHLGHARPAITFDILFRYFTHLGYKVRYVRNITDVGHLEDDADEGEDKIEKKARLEQLEPMEVAQRFAHLLSINGNHIVVHPIFHRFFTVYYRSLTHFRFVVREQQIHTSAVNVEMFS